VQDVPGEVEGEGLLQPGEKLYVVLDNFSPHRHAEVRAWATANDVDLVSPPPYGSWLDWIESEFTALRYFALNGIDRRTPQEQHAAITVYIRRRNARGRRKTRFGSDPTPCLVA
jgi:transposase